MPAAQILLRSFSLGMVDPELDQVKKLLRTQP
jgi:hypothetical protein